MTAPELRVSVDEPDGSTIERSLVRDPGVNAGFSEKSTARITRPLDPDWTFYIDDAPLASEHTGGAGSWIWKPGFYAGQVRGELVDPGGRTAARYLFDVSPSREKVGAAVFRSMVDEIWDYDPALVLGQEPPTRATGDLGYGQNALVEFERLRRHAPGFLAALEGVCERPLRSLRQTRRLLPIRSVRRADLATARSVAAQPALAAALIDPTAEVAVSAWTGVDAPVVERTLDGAANRSLAWIVDCVRFRCRTLRRRLESQVAAESRSATRTALGESWDRRKVILAALHRQIGDMLGRSPFCEVTRRELSAAGLNAISAQPLYALSAHRGWRCLKRGIAGTDTDERAWISPTWEIYENWCYLRVLAAARRARPALDWHRVSSPEYGSRDQWTGRGESAEVNVYLQPRFVSWSVRGERALYSISGERIPDIVVTYRRDGGESFVVYDAKYRASRQSVLDAMASAHIYRDALRLDDRRPEAAFLVVPDVGGAPWLNGQDFQQEHRVGMTVAEDLRLAEWLGG